MFPRLLTLFLAAVMTLAASSAEAQYYRFGRRGVVVRAPGAGVVVRPGGVRVSTPYGVYGYGRFFTPPAVAIGVGPTPAVAVDVNAPTPVVVSPAPVVTSSPIVTAKPSLEGLSQADLLATAANGSAELNSQLSTLNGGDGWRRYLALPTSVNLGVVEADKLKKLLERFDSVAGDSQFRMIAGLAGFEQTRNALRVLVETTATAPALPADAETPTEGPILLNNGARESLPTPAPEPTPVEEGAERSVLKL